MEDRKKKEGKKERKKDRKKIHFEKKDAQDVTPTKRKASLKIVSRIFR